MYTFSYAPPEKGAALKARNENIECRPTKYSAKSEQDLAARTGKGVDVPGRSKSIVMPSTNCRSTTCTSTAGRLVANLEVQQWRNFHIQNLDVIILTKGSYSKIIFSLSKISN